MRRGPKPKYQASPIIQNDLEQIIIDYRSKGYNKLIIAESLKKDSRIKKPCSASTIYRILKKYGYNKLTTQGHLMKFFEQLLKLEFFHPIHITFSAQQLTCV